MFCLCFCMLEVISSFRSLRAGSQVFALLMLFLCVILHTMSLGRSLQLLCIFPFCMCVRGVGGVCDMCMCLARGGVGGEGVSG